MFGVPSTCPRCNKRVYAAEQRLAEGKSWHSLCWRLEFKDRENAKKTQKDVTSYNKPADVSPAYYRVSDAASGTPARMEASTGTAVVAPGEYNASAPVTVAINTAPVNAAPVAEAPVGEAKFCSGCGKAREAGGARFCSGCGKAF